MFCNEISHHLMRYRYPHILVLVFQCNIFHVLYIKSYLIIYMYIYVYNYLIQSYFVCCFVFINHSYFDVEILCQNNQQLKIIRKTKNQKSWKLLIKIWSFLLKCVVLCSEHHVNIQFPGICRVDRYLSIDELNIFKPRIEKFQCMFFFLW